MDGALGKTWRNLRICQVVDAGRVWVREVPSQMCSEGMLQFLSMEKLMNHHFNSNFSHYEAYDSSSVKVGKLVVVRYNDCWARGIVEEVPFARGEKAAVFLLDYGITIVAAMLTIFPLDNDEWTSVPYQARKISLYGITPVSLQYSFVNEEMKVVLKYSKHWDTSATDFVRLLSAKNPQVEFAPLISQKGCWYGKLLVVLPKETWAVIMSDLSKSHWVQKEDNQMAIDLAQLLVDYEYAQQWQDEEGYFCNVSSCDSHHTDICKRHFKEISTGKNLSANTDDLKSTENLRLREQLLATLRAKRETEKLELHNFYSNSEAVCHFSIKSDLREMLINHTTGLKDMQSTAMKQNSFLNTSRTVRTNRVFVAGGPNFLDKEVVIYKDNLHTLLNSHIAKVLFKKEINPTRVQAFTWPVLTQGCSAVIVGEKSCGKTIGYIIPLLSTILDTHQHMNHRLPPGIGPLMVMVFSSWQSARYAANHVDKLLPDGSALRTVTTWGGCGVEEELRTREQLLGGCDLLLTTVPCLIRLLTGDSTLQLEGTTLTRCCHLVIDEADIVLEKYLPEVKHIITMWGEERKKCSRSDIELQAVLVSSKWTKSVSHLTHILLPLLDPTIIISAPIEAAIATRVSSYMHYVNNEAEAYDAVINFIASSYSQKKNMVFVKSDSDADLLGSLMKHVALYCLVINTTACMAKLELLLHEWHMMQEVTMIVSEASEASLLHHDLANAQTLFHTHLGSSWTTFSHRFGFMVDNFVTDIKEKSVDCESYIIVPQYSLPGAPKVWNELSRFSEMPSEIKVNSFSTLVKPAEDTPMCYYLKAFGRCFEDSCMSRHEFHISDLSHPIPTAGKVTLEVVEVLNASRYLAHLCEYQGKSDGQSINLSNHYYIMNSALQKHYADPSHHQPLSDVEKGRLCAVDHAGQWSRAKVISVNFSKSTTLLEVFLIDKGKEVSLNMNSAVFLPLHFAKVPQLIVEVFLCCVQPLDQDTDWTPQAANFICQVFAKKKSRFVGEIAFASGHTMWLNPVVEFSKIGKKYIKRKSLRGKLLSEKFGMDNPSHLRNLEELCSQAQLPFRREDVCTQSWIEIINDTLQTTEIPGDAESLNADTMSCDKTVTELKHASQKNEGIIDKTSESGDGSYNPLKIPDIRMFSQLKSGTNYMNPTTKTLVHEELPFHTEVRVHIAEVVSPGEFYVIREDRHQELDALEDEIQSVHDFLEYCEVERKPHHHSYFKSPDFKPSLGVICLARFTDKRYYRAEVKGGDPDDNMTVFFIDHGETLEVPSWQIHACPSAWAEYLPGQAIRCSLAQLTLPSSLQEAATQAMVHLADITESWTVKALDVKDEDGPLYTVVLKDCASNREIEMHKELIHQDLALTDSKMVPCGEETSVFQNLANIADQEIEDFLQGLSACNQDMTTKPMIVQSFHMKCKTANDSEHKDNNLPFALSVSKTKHSYDTVKHNSNYKLTESETDEYINSVDINECNESISGDVDPLLNINNERKYSAVEQSGTKRQDNHRVKGNEISSKDYNHSLSVISSSGKSICKRHVQVPPLCAVDGVTPRLFPETSWSQKEDTVCITIHLVGVEQYQCCINSSHLLFTCILGDKFYVLDEELPHEVINESSAVSVQGLYVSITLKKANEEKWMSLFKSSRHRPWLRGDFEKLLSGNSSDTENCDDDGWRECSMNKELHMGGLPAGISDTDDSGDIDYFGN